MNDGTGMRNYQTWVDETEEDIEAEKVISDIKNLKQEKLFNIYFNRSAADVDLDALEQPSK